MAVHALGSHGARVIHGRLPPTVPRTSTFQRPSNPVGDTIAGRGSNKPEASPFTVWCPVGRLRRLYLVPLTGSLKEIKDAMARLDQCLWGGPDSRIQFKPLEEFP
jgi:hypothetical protein